MPSVTRNKTNTFDFGIDESVRAGVVVSTVSTVVVVVVVAGVVVVLVLVVVAGAVAVAVVVPFILFVLMLVLTDLTEYPLASRGRLCSLSRTSLAEIIPSTF